MEQKHGINLVFYTRQPFVAAGLRSVLTTSPGLRLLHCCDTAAATLNCLRSARPDILLVHLTSGSSLAELAQLKACGDPASIVLWGDLPGGDFGFQAMQLGVRAILPNDMPVEAFLTALRNVHCGVLCFEKWFVDKMMVQARVMLTKRQGEILALVAQGLKNKAIGTKLGITEGTVKVYIYKLFKKLGVNDRLEMALYGLENLSGGSANRGQTTRKAAKLFSPRSLPVQTREEVSLQRVN